MAFTSTQLLTLGEVLGLTPLQIENHFDVFPYDANIQEYVEGQLTRWETASLNFTRIEPNMRNFGARINPGDEKAEIRKNIALALGFDISSLGFGQATLARG